jgi:hypothetical protein
MRRWLAAFLMAGALVGLSGCASTTKSGTGANEEEDLSTLPWNRPQRWEGAGAMGGFLPQSQ